MSAGSVGAGAASVGSAGGGGGSPIRKYTLSTYTVLGSPDMMSWARLPLPVSPPKSASARSSRTHCSVARPSLAVIVSSCSLSSPPPSQTPLAPKSTSFTLNAAASVGSGVQMSMRKWVMSVTSMGAEVNSIPANTRPEYLFAAFPAMLTSSTSASSQSADQVSTAASS